MDRCFAILADIHANIEALNAVIEDARGQGATDFVCVGDIVGYNAAPAECIKIVRDAGMLCVRGNHDHYCHVNESLADFQPAAASVIDWTRRALNETDANWLGAQPLSRVVSGLFTAVHATLDMPQNWGYVFDALQADTHFTYQQTQLCFHGHTHVPIIFEKAAGRVFRAEPGPTRFKLGAKYFINAGSVGQPRDGDPRASYMIYHAKPREAEFRRVSYDIITAAARVRRAGLPERLARRLETGK
jgi:diadenosine tetraphosphatase ApaH/serine/threonine PP2A family protein phosphatase